MRPESQSQMSDWAYGKKNRTASVCGKTNAQIWCKCKYVPRQLWCVSPVWIGVLCHVSLTQLHPTECEYTHTHMDTHMGSHMGWHVGSHVDTDKIVIFLSAVKTAGVHSEVEKLIPLSFTCSSTVIALASASPHGASSTIYCVQASSFFLYFLYIPPFLFLHFQTRAVFNVYPFRFSQVFTIWHDPLMHIHTWQRVKHNSFVWFPNRFIFQRPVFGFFLSKSICWTHTMPLASTYLT